MNTITANELNGKFPSPSLRIVDVRTPAEFEDVHIDGAELRPLDSFKPEELQDTVGGQSICLVCHSGKRAKQAAEKLVSAGIADTLLLDGGMVAWQEAGLPVIEGRKTISLERQVRIAAGLLAFSGTILGLTQHPYWHGLAGFIGAGLVFAGLTDTCGLAMVIAKMPWNQRG